MKFTTRLITATVLASLGATAMAIEAEQASTWMTPSVKSRAEVKAETVAAMRDGSLSRNESSYTVVPGSGSSLTRAQVMAEAREAMRLGLIPVHEGYSRVATPAENEQIRQAGLRAINASTQLAGK
jgi:Domain of unknown function (DUF4148)